MTTLDGKLSRLCRAMPGHALGTRASRQPRLFAAEVARGYADATGADAHMREEISALAMVVGEHLAMAGQPGAWTRIDIAELAEQMPEEGDARRLQLFRLGAMLEWMAEERLIPFVRAIDYGIEIDRVAALPDAPTAASC